MVCLNNKLPINLVQMKHIILKNLDDIIDHELYFVDDKILNDDKKNKIKNKIIRELKNKFNSDNFIYLMIDDNHCGHKIKRGKLDGNFCCKKITSNGSKKNYVCTKHNKNHVPKKRIPKKEETKITLAKNDISINNSCQNKKVNEDNIPQKRYLDQDDQCQDKYSQIINNNISKINGNVDILKNKKINHVTQIRYKNRFILNKDGMYTKIIKEIPLLDFCVNKLKKSKYKNNYIHNSFLYLDN